MRYSPFKCKSKVNGLSKSKVIVQKNTSLDYEDQNSRGGIVEFLVGVGVVVSFIIILGMFLIM